MKYREDFIMLSNGDFPLEDVYKNGILQPTNYGFSENQHLKDLLEYDKGDLISDPSAGFGINNRLNSEIDVYSLQKELTMELEKDKFTANTGVIVPVGKDGFIVDGTKIKRT